VRVPLFFAPIEPAGHVPHPAAAGATDKERHMANKNKTNRSLKKRFKITASGKLKHSHGKRRHLLAGRTSKKKRHLRKAGVTTSPTADAYIIAMGGL
jgi:large subunit ribosomal protein L35